MKVHVESRSGRQLGSFDLQSGATIEALQQAFQLKFPKYHINRQRFYHHFPPPPSTPSSASASTSDTTTPSKSAPPLSKKPSSKKRSPAYSPKDVLSDGLTVVFKDLGPQVSWQTVFLIEYLGPLLVYPLFYSQPSWIYTIPADITSANPGVDPKWVEVVQFSALIAWTFHYTKRELETLFIHRFSNATMPWTNLFKNSFYYWGFAAYVAYFVNHPLYTPPPEDLVYSGMCLFYFMEIGNLSAHWTLRTLRPPGTKIRRIPHGGLFEFVSCPNYTYEILSWLGFNLMTRTVAGILFMTAGAVQMLIWAKGKHRRYRTEFDGKDGRPLYPPSRKMLIPFLY